MNPRSAYPILVPEDPRLPSLAKYPLDVILLIVDFIFQPFQIITIDITGPPHRPRVELTPVEANTISERTKVLLRPPPLYALTRVCRLFQYVYRQNHPTPFGAHLHRRIAYHVDLTRDIFHIRLHRRVASWEWERALMATSVNYISGWNGPAIWSANYLRHLNTMATKLMILVPGYGVEEEDELDLEPTLEPLKDKTRIWDGDEPVKWKRFKTEILAKLRLNETQYFTDPANDEERAEWERSWRLCPVPEVTGWAVDERRLDDSRAWALYQPELYEE
ncbi:hypothetical protein NEMBOFW57_002721 [Staphylotrichum longicolle]|uniref:Uncharacterized protein n=1 Tax=Staphylotrichum longicolle TaxID=669026 RepID=A0AAD4HYX9_9PEZI|nr:hypothetical protein NEMBOFW57_002721 [Staphylotrichum longicolle]